MLKLHLCVPSYCADLLQHGRGMLVMFVRCCQCCLVNDWIFLHRWVFHFAHLRQLPVLVPYIPTENPRLRDTAYEVSKLAHLWFSISQISKQGFIFIWYQVLFNMLQVALVTLATNPAFHKELLSTVKSWPRVIYSVLPVISAIEPQLNTSSMTDSLKEVGQHLSHSRCFLISFVCFILL